MRAPIGEMEEQPEADCIPGAPHPRRTTNLFGQDKAESAFLKAYNTGRVHHAWLICGSHGIGKATLAWRIARFLLAQPAAANTLVDADLPKALSLQIDQDTPVYRRSTQLAEPRLCLIRRAYDAKKGKHAAQISVEDVRKLNNFFHMSATDGGHRVVIVDSADEMNTAAANALLKTLEEPPKDAVILLISHQPSRLLPTIRSRCRELRLTPLPAQDLSQALEAAGFETAQHSDALAELSAGSVGEALRLSNLDGMAIYREIISILGTLPNLDRQRALRLAESCTGASNVDRYDLVLNLFNHFLTRQARTGAGCPPLVEAATNESQLMQRLAPTAYAAKDWAILQQDVSARAAHARAVNLDPAALILDMIFKITDTASRVTAT